MPSSRVVDFTDPHQYQAAIRAGTMEVVPTTAGNFRAELVQIDFHRLWLQRRRVSLPQIVHGPVNADRAAIEFPIEPDRPATRYRGIDVMPGEIVVHDTNPVHRRSFAPASWGAMSLTPADLIVAGRALVGRELTPPSVMRVVRPLPALMAHLLTLHNRAAQLAKTAPDRLTHAKVARSLEQGLIHAMVRCLNEGTPIELRAVSRRHSAVIERFEEFLAANQHEPVYLAELCAAIGVAEHTLRVCCQEHLGMRPVRYLWLRRMHLARCALMRADPAAATVTAIATDYGFWELGRFSVEYRALFGESPSASLHRPPDDRRVTPNRPCDLPEFAY